jgi:glutathione peroxidase
MNKIYLLILFLMVQLSMSSQNKNFYDFKVNDIDGKEISLKEFKGKKVLVVNVASKCGFTKQYKDLQALYEKYGGDKFSIVAFPANNFLSQEPGTNSEIKEFCSREFHVTFPMMAKISVKGDDMHPLYKWLTSKNLNGKLDTEVSWNFQKFMIDEQGNLLDFVPPKEKPDCEKIVNWILGI